MRERIAAHLGAWRVGPGDVAISGGVRRAALSHRLPVESLKRIFACLLYVVVGKMLLA